jgi:general secretion pathway protein C
MPGISLARLFLWARLTLVALGLVGFLGLGVRLVRTLAAPVPRVDIRASGLSGATPLPSPPNAPPLGARKPVEELAKVFLVSKSLDVGLETRGHSLGQGLSPSAVPGGIGEKLGIKLLGTVSGTQELSYAVILDESKAEEAPYKVGGSIKGAKVVAIEPLQVIFEHEGRRQALKMEFDFEQSWVFKEAPQTMQHERKEGGSGSELTIPRQEIEKELASPDIVARKATILPAFKSGRPNGFMILNISRGSVFSKIGLLDGDIIQSVNGQPINGGFTLAFLLAELNQKGEATLAIERNLSPLQLNVKLR